MLVLVMVFSLVSCNLLNTPSNTVVVYVDENGHIVVNGTTTQYRVETEDVVYVNDDGYLVVNGVITDYKVQTNPTNDSNNGNNDNDTGDDDHNDSNDNNNDDDISIPTTQDALVIGIDTLPNSLNPFYSDKNDIVDITQLPLLEIDKEGEEVCICFGRE